MIDFIKLQASGTSIKELLNNDLLDFEGRYNEKTGEINPRIKEAKYKDLKFSIVDEKYINISGSIHKYFSGGINHNDFSFKNINETINNLEQNFNIDPFMSKIHNLEFGVNILLRKDPNEIINHIVDYLGNPFNKMRARNSNIGVDCYMQQYGVKVYNKGLQCRLNTFSLRFEIKVTRMIFLKKPGIFVLIDLTKKEKMKVLGEILLKIFDQILICNPDVNPRNLTKKDKELYTMGQNPKFWEKLKGEDRESFFKDRSRFKSICATKQNSIQNEVRNLILEKWISLLNL